MNKYFHYYGPLVFGTLFGFALGYGFRCREVKLLKNKITELSEEKHTANPETNPSTNPDINPDINPETDTNPTGSN